MGEIINIDEYKKSMKNFELIKPEDIKKYVEEKRIGDFAGKEDKEIKKYYEDLSDAINNVYKNPCGTTAFEIGKLLEKFKINYIDFQGFFSIVNEKRDAINREKVESTDKVEDIDKIEISDEEKLKRIKSEIDFYQSQLDELQKKIDDDNSKYNKASTPFKAKRDIFKSVHDNLKNIFNKNRFRKISDSLMEKMVSLGSQVEKLKTTSKKPTFKNKAKTTSNVSAKKGTAEITKSKSDLRKEKKTRKVLETAKNFSEQLVAESKRKHDISKVDEQTLAKSPFARDIEAVRGNLNHEDIDNVMGKVSYDMGSSIKEIRQALENIKSSKIKMELKDYGLTDEQISEFLYSSCGHDSKAFGINNDGSLEISKYCKYLNANDIKGTSLERHLQKYAMMPSIVETKMSAMDRFIINKEYVLSDEEVVQLAKCLEIKNGIIKFSPSRLIDENTIGDYNWINDSRSKLNPQNFTGENFAEWLDLKNSCSERSNTTYIRTSNSGVPEKTKVITRPANARLNLFSNLEGSDFYVNGMEGAFSVLKLYERVESDNRILDELDDIEELSQAVRLDEHFADMIKMEEKIENKTKITKDDRIARDDLEKIAKQKMSKAKRSDLKSMAERKVLKLIGGDNLVSILDRSYRNEKEMLSKGLSRLEVDKIIEIGDKKIEEIKKSQEGR